jgi:hypothetical protein
MIAPYPEHMPAAADEEAERKYELVKVIALAHLPTSM